MSSSVTLPPEKYELVKSVALGQGFTNYKLNVTSGSMKGDGYLGVINTVDIEDENDHEKSLHLIIKSALIEETLRQNSPIRKAYEREAYLYETVFAEFETLFHELGVENRFTETATYYGSLLSERQECLLLENLKKRDFSMWNRKLPMNAEHVALVFATYGKFHGSGLALKYLKPEKYQEISKNLVNIFRKENETEADKKKFGEDAKGVFAAGFRAVADNPKATEALTRFAQNIVVFFKETLRNIEFTTIIHGDCWCNNMMFKYDDLENPSKPTTMRLLDWQISQIGSPVQDLSYFFYACGSREVFYNQKKFLKMYHKNLSETLESAGLDPDEIFTYEELEKQWKTYSCYGLFMSIFVMKVMLGDAEEAPDLTQLGKTGKNIMECITATESTHTKEIDERISNIIEFMMDSNYL